MSNLQLFVACVAIWSSTWIAITFQLGAVAPELSVFYRFFLASLLLFAGCLLGRVRLRFPPADHAWFALFGVLTFSVSYVFVYYAERHVVSGLVAVGYSANPLLAMLGLRAFFGTALTMRMALASLLGIAGIALIFLPQFSFQAGEGVIEGAAFTAAAVVASALGSMVAHRLQRERLPLWQTMAWGMLYGSGFSLLAVLATGKPLAFEPTVRYVGSLLYLAVFGSVAAFAGYLTLLSRIGAARAGYIGVMVPVVALLISAAFEGFRWEVLTLAGVALSIAGNVLALKDPAARGA
jgi:drug/metabolite transporter (DMT)-like permease